MTNGFRETSTVIAPEEISNFSSSCALNLKYNELDSQTTRPRIIFLVYQKTVCDSSRPMNYSSRVRIRCVIFAIAARIAVPKHAKKLNTNTTLHIMVNTGKLTTTDTGWLDH
jgi:hypothetical protein